MILLTYYYLNPFLLVIIGMWSEHLIKVDTKYVHYYSLANFEDLF